MDNDAILQDLTLEVAAKMADPSLKFNPNYYRMKAWQPYVSTSKRTKHICDIELRDLLSSLQEPLDTNLKTRETLEPAVSVKKSNVDEGTWNTFFISKPHSNDTIRALLPDVIEAIQDVKDNIGGWQTPSRLQSAVAAWLKGQKEVLFYQSPIHCAGDIIDKIRK